MSPALLGNDYADDDNDIDVDQVDEDNATISIFFMTFNHHDDQNYHNDHHHHPSVATNVQCQLVKQEGHDNDFDDDKKMYT